MRPTHPPPTVLRPERPTARAHREIAALLQPGDLAIDATAGNGHDTLFLANLIGDTGQVLAFDIQRSAIDASLARITAAGFADRVTFVLGSHATLAEHADDGTCAAIMFNLGYLPGGDHTQITRTAETLQALDAAVRGLKPGGILTIVCYPGHPGGDEESTAVVAWSEKHSATVFRHDEAPPTSPFLVVFRRD